MNDENKNKPELRNFCNETELFIDEFLEGMISLKDQQRMDEHLLQCDYCKKYLADSSALIKDLKTLDKDSADLSGKKKNEIWKKVNSGIDNSILNSKPENTAEKNSDHENFLVGFISRYKYYVSGVAALIIIGFIIFGVKNLQTGSDRLSQQSSFGLTNYWKVTNLEGNSQIDNVNMTSNDSIKEGQWIQTDALSKAELMIANLGKVIIEPNSKIVFVKSAEGNNRILVEYGTIQTTMNPNSANSRSFFVEMPSAVATDNGGSYTLTVDSTGDGLLYVRSGKVEVESQNREAIIPAGNIVLTKKNYGVGTPFNENSSPKFKNALINYDFGNCSGSCVSTLLNNAKMSDAVTLVNLIPKLDKQYQEKVYTKLVNFVPPPDNHKTHTIHADSMYFFDEEQLNEWIDKIQVEVQVNVEKSLENVARSLENIKDLEYMSPEKLKELEDFAKDWKIKIKTSPKGTYVWEDDTLEFNKEEFEQDMEELKKDIEESKKDNNEQLQIDMKDLKEGLQEMQIELKKELDWDSEELKKELQKANEEIKKALEDPEVKKHLDSVKFYYQHKEKDNDPEVDEEKEINNDIKDYESDTD